VFSITAIFLLLNCKEIIWVCSLKELWILQCIVSKNEWGFKLQMVLDEDKSYETKIYFLEWIIVQQSQTSNKSTLRIAATHFFVIVH
jgi:hypothetical protein